VSLERKPLIVAAIPAYDEEETIAKVIVQARKHVDKIIVCDDGSTDLTGKIAEAMGAIVVTHKRNLGKGVALRTLFARAREMGADITVTVDADGQHDAKEIPRLIEAMNTSGVDIVVGSRFMKESDADGNVPSYRAVGNRILSILTDWRVRDTQSGFRAYNRAAIRRLRPTARGMGVDSEILMKAKETGLRTIEIPINVSYDVAKPSKHNFLFQSTQVMLSIARYFSIRRPFVFYGLPGMSALLVGLAFWIWIFQVFLKTGQIIADFAVTALALTIIGLFLLLVSLGLWALAGPAKKK
jgi:glycosyltransferase involved in cell wall biosynthesis